MILANRELRGSAANLARRRAGTRGVEATRDAMRLTMRASRDGRVLCVDEVFTNESGDRARVPGEYGCVGGGRRSAAPRFRVASAAFRW